MPDKSEVIRDLMRRYRESEHSSPRELLTEAYEAGRRAATPTESTPPTRDDALKAIAEKNPAGLADSFIYAFRAGWDMARAATKASVDKFASGEPQSPLPAKENANRVSGSVGDDPLAMKSRGDQ